MKWVECVVLLLLCITLVHSEVLNEEFTWTKITYSWPEDYKHQGHHRALNGNYDKIVFEGPTNAATAGKRPPGEKVPSYINYQMGKK